MYYKGGPFILSSSSNYIRPNRFTQRHQTPQQLNCLSENYLMSPFRSKNQNYKNHRSPNHDFKAQIQRYRTKINKQINTRNRIHPSIPSYSRKSSYKINLDLESKSNLRALSSRAKSDLCHYSFRNQPRFYQTSQSQKYSNKIHFQTQQTKAKSGLQFYKRIQEQSDQLEKKIQNLLLTKRKRCTTKQGLKYNQMILQKYKLKTRTPYTSTPQTPISDNSRKVPGVIIQSSNHKKYLVVDQKQRPMSRDLRYVRSLKNIRERPYWFKPRYLSSLKDLDLKDRIKILLNDY